MTLAKIFRIKIKKGVEFSYSIEIASNEKYSKVSRLILLLANLSLRLVVIISILKSIMQDANRS